LAAAFLAAALAGGVLLDKAFFAGAFDIVFFTTAFLIGVFLRGAFDAVLAADAIFVDAFLIGAFATFFAFDGIINSLK
jgi:hypothetical protein